MINWQLDYDQITKLFLLYNKTGNWHSFIRDGLKLEYDHLDQNKLSLIWQAFDRAAEEWQKREFHE
jgi:hypothetical protein